MKGPLGNCVISVAGDFGTKRSAADLKRWIEANGGEFAAGISPRVTHLVCSNTAFKHPTPHVKAAQKQAKITIVSYDWLEDSLLEKRKKSEIHYLCATIQKKRQEQVVKRKVLKNKYMDHKKPIENFNTSCEEARIDLHSDNYHVYQDDTSFAYHIILTRPDNIRYNIDKVVLKLYETSVIRPAQYAVVATWDKRDPVTMKPNTQILVPKGSPFHTAFAIFRKFFQQITGVEWDFRSFSRAMPLHMSGQQALRHEGWRVEAIAPEHMARCREVSFAFLDGDFSPHNIEQQQFLALDELGRLLPSNHNRRDPTSAKDTCYQYRLPMPNLGEPRGSQGMLHKGEMCFGKPPGNQERIGGGRRALAENCRPWEKESDG